MATNAERLKDAGLVKSGDLPEPYAGIVDELSPQEVEMLVSVKQRIDSAGDVIGHSGETNPPEPDDVFGLL